MSETFAELDALPTRELQDRAFTRAREERDISFFWTLFEHLPAGESGNDGALGVQSTVDDAVAVWRETTDQEYGDEEPMIRAVFIDYLINH
jgi:hypothetical protein